MEKKYSVMHLESLLLLSLAGELTAEQKDELSEMLRSSEEMRFIAAEFMQLEAMLLEQHRVEQAAGDFLSTADAQCSEALFSSSSPRVFASTRLIGPLALAVACLGGVIGVAVYQLGRGHRLPGVAAVRIAEDALPLRAAVMGEDVYVGTVTLESGARWVPEVGLGSKLRAGKIQLEEGVGRIHTSDGAILCLDARERPVQVRLASGSAVSVDAGVVLAKAYGDSGGGLSLDTPSARVIDLGTEFSVSVGEDGGSSVSVYDGAVTYMSSGAAPRYDESMLMAGQTVRFTGASGATAEPLLSDSSFGSVIDKVASASGSRRLIATAPFTDSLGVMSAQSSGQGWEAHWTRGKGMRPASGVIRRGGLIVAPPWMQRGSASYCALSLAATARRRFADPIVAKPGESLYVSFLMRKKMISSDDPESGGAGVMFFSGATKVVGVSNDSRNKLTLFLGPGRFRAIRRLDDDQCYLIVLKMQFGENGRHGVFAHAIAPSDPPEAVQPKAWSGTGRAFRGDAPIDGVSLWSGAASIVAFDEVRIGWSWASVVRLTQ